MPPKCGPKISSHVQAPADGSAVAASVAKELHWLEKLNILGQLSLVIVGIIAAAIYGFQLKTMNQQLAELQDSGKQTDQLISLYAAQVTKLKDLSEQTTKLATETHDLAVEAKKQADASARIADSGRFQSEATQRIAVNSAAQLTTMKETLEIDHRAWIKVVDVVPEHSLTLESGVAQLNFAVNYTNAGNLPATNVLLRADMIAQKPNEGVFELEKKEAAFCEEAAKGAPISSDFSELLYPSAPSEQHYIARTQLDSSYIRTFQGSNMKLLSLFIVGCFNYRFMSSTKDHQVGFIYEVLQKLSDTSKFFGAIQAEKSLEKKDIALNPYLLGRKIAN